MAKAKASPWLRQMKKPLKLRSPAHSRMAVKRSAAIFFVEASGERFRKTGRTEMSRWANCEIQDCRRKGSRGTRFPLAELRGGRLFSGFSGEMSRVGRG